MAKIQFGILPIYENKDVSATEQYIQQALLPFAVFDKELPK